MTSQKQSSLSSAGRTEVLTVGEWMDRWLEKYAKPAIKLSTYCSYEQYVRGHIKPLLGAKYLNTLTAEDLQDFFNDRAKSGNSKARAASPPKTWPTCEYAPSGLFPSGEK